MATSPLVAEEAEDPRQTGHSATVFEDPELSGLAAISG